MNAHPKVTIGWILSTIPVLATLSFGISPSRAATFGSATTSVTSLNFNQNAESSNVIVDSTAIAISPTGTSFDDDSLDTAIDDDEFLSNVEAINDTVVALADFSTIAFFPSTDTGSSSSFVNSETSNEAFGTGDHYSGQSQTESTIFANFFINPQAGTSETFSFDFTNFWRLETLATENTTETTLASASTSLTVCGRAALNESPLFCDFLSAEGQIDSLDQTGLFAFNQSDAFLTNVLVEPSASFDPSLNLNQAEFFALGSYQRTVETPIYLTVTQVQTTSVNVQATPVKTPEPSTLVALLSLSGLTIALNQRKKSSSV